VSIDATPLFFFDASCLIAAAGRPHGGSGYVLPLCRRRLLRAAVSHPVLVEVDRNIERNFPDAALPRYHDLLIQVEWSVGGVPSGEERSAYRELVGAKDDHVVAAAIAAGAPFLPTLDKRLAAAVNAAKLPIRALSPGEFINDVLPTHVAARLLWE